MGSKESTSREVPSKISTGIWADVPDDSGKKTTVCHGYDFYGDLLGRYSFTELLFLLLRGELPEKKEAALLERIMTGMINPGPKAWETAAAMTASVSRTTVGNMMMAGLAALQGRYNGALCVEKAMALLQAGLQSHCRGKSMGDVATQLESTFPDLPGFGLDRERQDARAAAILTSIKKDRLNGIHVDFAESLEAEINRLKKTWLTVQGLSAAVFLDLGFDAADGHGIYILASMPGVLAHGLEQMKKGNWNTFPFYETPDYTPESIKDLDKDHHAYTR